MDFVISWVDGNDPEWKEQFLSYKSEEQGDTSEARFRDWENLQYWFRGVEKFAPWVDKIHFITWGHLPSWLDINHPKLNIVKHSDFIPDKYLPTFNSRTIALNIHRIEGLKEEYVYFNDDTFIIDHVEEETFFKNGKPCDMAISTVLTGSEYSFSLFKNISVINKHFSKRKAVKNKPFNWFNFKYGLKSNIKNLLLVKCSHTGFNNHHLPKPSIKKTLEVIWGKEYEVLDEACSSRFRNYTTANDYIQQYWQLASNNFYPINLNKYGERLVLKNIELSEVVQFLEEQKKKMVCLNDYPDLTNFQEAKETIKTSFEKILPQKSGFEKSMDRN